MKHTTIKILAVTGSLLTLPASLSAQEKETPKATKPGAGPKAESIQVIYEVFSLPLTEAAAILRSAPADTAFYQKMVEGVRAKKVSLEVFLMGRGVSGQRIIVEQVAEHIYATEFEPPELPNQTSGGAGFRQDAKGKVHPAAFPVTPATPTSFDTRKVGDTIELEIALDQNKVYADIRFSAWTTAFIQRDVHGQGMAKTEMPRFSNQQINGGITAVRGLPTFLGTISPPEELQPANNDEENVWFAFVTTKLVAQ